MNRQHIQDWIVAYLVPGWLWRTWHKLRHPRSTYYQWKKERAYPEIGDLVEYCDGATYIVTAQLEYGDIELSSVDTGVVVHPAASWMACCEKSPR